MNLTTLSLLDLLVGLLVLGAAIQTLRRGSGLLAAIGSGLGTLVLAWIMLAAAAAWTTAPVASAARDSAVVRAVEPPHRVLDQVGALVDDLVGGTEHDSTPPTHEGERP